MQSSYVARAALMITSRKMRTRKRKLQHDAATLTRVGKSTMLVFMCVLREMSSGIPISRRKVTVHG